MANTLRIKRGLASGLPTGVAGEPLFTTDTFDLYIGTGAANQRYQKYIASGTTLQYLRGDGSLATFPTNIITGTGVNGQVAYWSGASTQTGSNNLFWDNTNGRLGIGTNVPSESMQVVGGNILIDNNRGYRTKNTGGSSLEVLKLDTSNSLLLGSIFAGGQFISYTSTSFRWFQYPSSVLTERMQLTSLGNLLLQNGGTFTDSGQRLQVTGDTLLKGSGNTSATTALTVQNSDAANLLRVRNDGALIVGVRTSEENYIAGYTSTSPFGAGQRTMAFVWGTASGSRPNPSFYFTSANNINYTSTSGDFIQTSFTFNPTSGTGIINTHLISPTINQTGGANGITRGLYVNPTLTAAADWRSIEWSNNTGWGLRGEGTAPNYLGGSLGIGSTALTGYSLRISKSITGGTSAVGVLQSGTFLSDVTSIGRGFLNQLNTQAAAFSLFEYYHFDAVQGTIGASSSVSNQYGFRAADSLIGATNNYGFLGSIPSGTGRWNLFMNGTAANFLSGNTQIGTGAFTSEKLQVNGTMKVSGTAAMPLLVERTTASSNIGIQYKNATNSWYSGQADNENFAISTLITLSLGELQLTRTGNLGLGTASPTSRLDVTQSGSTAGISVSGGTNPQMRATDGTITAKVQAITGLAAYIGTESNHQLRFIVNNSPIVNLFTTGNVSIASTSDTGEKLQVNGTMKVTGASTFGNVLQINGAASVPTSGGGLELAGNTTTGSITSFNRSLGTYLPLGINTLSYSFLTSGTEKFAIANSGAANFTSSLDVAGKGSFGNTLQIAGGTIAPTSGAGLELGGGSTTGSITSFNRSLGTFLPIVFNTLSYSFLTSNTERFAIASTGAATFSSSVTAASLGVNVSTIRTRSEISAILAAPTALNTNVSAGNLLLSDGGNIGLVMGLYDTSFDSYIQARNNLGSNNIAYSLLLNPLGGNVGINRTSASYALDVTGEARVSSAIAIGTTPDTNKPFKILKNINATVGINFENTSTSSLAFSAIQMGTDVTGGTKFTNLVYASSGVSASGVYNPDGTSLINNGNGGLNFLGNPIRLYTGGSNGVLRLMLDNEGTTQYTATTPTTNATDGYKQYSADVVAGNAAPHFRTENGGIIKLYQETTGVGNAIFSQGGGTSVLDDSTFDGYTLRQIVKALRNQGILA